MVVEFLEEVEPLFAEERRKVIMDILHQRKKIRVNEIAKELGVSAVTIRKDLEALEASGLLVRTHGGAVLPDHSRSEWGFFKKLNQRKDKKVKIAKKAFEMIEEGDTIILDSSSTTYYIAEEIRKRGKNPLTVVTNNIFIAEKLIGLPGIDVIVLGGSIRENSLSLVGPWALRHLEEIKVDKAFLGTMGFSPEKGFMTPSLVEADVKKAMVESASEVFIVTDSSKFSRGAFAVFAQPEDVDHVITDSGIPEDVEAFLRERDVNVIKV